MALLALCLSHDRQKMKKRRSGNLIILTRHNDERSYAWRLKRHCCYLNFLSAERWGIERSKADQIHILNTSSSFSDSKSVLLLFMLDVLLVLWGLLALGMQYFQKIFFQAVQNSKPALHLCKKKKRQSSGFFSAIQLLNRVYCVFLISVRISRFLKMLLKDISVSEKQADILSHLGANTLATKQAPFCFQNSKCFWFRQWVNRSDRS